MKKLERSEKKKLTSIWKYQTKGGEIKFFLKRVSQENEKTTRNQTILQKFHRRNKHIGCSPFKILGTILEMEAIST